MNYKVFLPTAGIGSRMGELTKYTNKSLAKIGDKPAISYIVERYPEEVEIIVVLGHFGNHVKDFLSIAYPNRKFTFVNVPNYKDKGSSLICSFLACIDKIDCPFVFHACDTIVHEEIKEPSVDWLGGSWRIDLTNYTSLVVVDGKAVQVCDKGQAYRGSAAFIGLAGIYSWREFISDAAKLYSKFREMSELSNIHVHLDQISRKAKYEFIEFQSWEDIGNEAALEKVRSKYKCSLTSLPKKDEAIYRVGEKVIKFYSNEEVTRRKVQRAAELAPLVPHIVDIFPNFFSYKFVEGDVLSTRLSEDLFIAFLDWCSTNLWLQHGLVSSIWDECVDFYFEKTRERLRDFFKRFKVVDEACIINGVNVPGASSLLCEIPAKDICTSRPCRIHGDLILDNVVFTGSSFVLMDWRQSFGKSVSYGDIYYDLAKVNGSLTFSQELITQGLFYLIDLGGKEVRIGIYISRIMEVCSEIFWNFLKKNDLSRKRVELLTSLMWLNMCPLHEEKLAKFLYYFGRFNLFRCLRRV